MAGNNNSNNNNNVISIRVACMADSCGAAKKSVQGTYYTLLADAVGANEAEAAGNPISK